MPKLCPSHIDEHDAGRAASDTRRAARDRERQWPSCRAYRPTAGFFDPKPSSSSKTAIRKFPDSSGAKVFGAYKITALLTKQELTGYNDSQGNPAYRTIQTGFNFELTSNATSTETGGGFQCTIGPVNDRS